MSAVPALSDQPAPSLAPRVFDGGRRRAQVAIESNCLPA